METSAKISTLGKRQRYEILRSQLDTEFNQFKSQFRDLNDYILPSRGRFFVTDVNRGDRRNLKIIDNTATTSLRVLSSGMMAGITSPSRPWFKLGTPDPELNEFGAARVWLHTVNQRMNSLFSKSNLYNVLPNVYEELGGFGTACAFMVEDFKTTSRFYDFSIGTYRIAKDHEGRVNVFMREFAMTVDQVVRKFGMLKENGRIDWSNISTSVKNLYETGGTQQWVYVVHVIEPNADWDPSRMESKFKKFRSVYYERGNSGKSGQGGVTAGIDDDKFLEEKGYDFFPILAPRWQVSGGDVYATNCPGMVVIGDVKQLQHGEKRGAQALDKIVNPAMVGPSSLKTTKASILPGDITYLDERDGSFKEAHQVRISFQELELKQESIRRRIRTGMFEDLFLMLANDTRSQITATEIVERKEEKLLALGPVLNQVDQDVLNPLIENQFMLMQRQGLLPPAPEELQGMDLKVEYISILFQAQKMMGLGAIERFVNFSAGVVKLNPATADKIDFDQLIDEYAEGAGVSPRIVRTDEAVIEIREAQQQRAMQDAQAQKMLAASQSVRNLSQAKLDENSALSKLVESAGSGGAVEDEQAIS